MNKLADALEGASQTVTGGLLRQSHAESKTQLTVLCTGR